MKLRYFYLVLLALLPLVATAESLKPSRPELAGVLGFVEEIARSPEDSPLFVRVFAVPTSNMECEHTKTCPDVRLLITVMNGDEDEKPILFELPAEKGWRLNRWLPKQNDRKRQVGFTLTTTIPQANLDPQERTHWRPKEYRVWVGEDSASYEQ